jgi:biotin carboxylase
MTRPSVVLLASGHSYRLNAFRQAADRVGLDTIVGLDVPPPLLGRSGAQLALDYRDLPRSTRRLLEFAAGLPAGPTQIAAIIGVDDSGALLAAQAGAALNLPHNAYEATLAARDKARMRRAFARAAVPSPPFLALSIDDDPELHAAALEAGTAELTFPVVIKPTTRAGSQGVMRADTPAEFVNRFERLRRLMTGDGCRDVLVEAFIPGVEVALEGLLRDGELQVLALFDKPDPLDGPFFEETIYTTPSRLPADTRAAIAAAAAQAAEALGLRTGPIHAELRVNDQGPWLLEVAARSIGGQCSRTLRFGTDLSLEELILRHALGEDVASLSAGGQAGGVMMIPIPRAGIFREVAGVEAARALPLIEAVEISARAHYPLVPLPEGDSYLGFIFARGETPAAVEQALRAAHGLLTFRIDDPLPLRVQN